MHLRAKDLIISAMIEILHSDALVQNDAIGLAAEVGRFDNAQMG
jgi:hypothetical protein